jgi:hypothetical protein
MPSSMTAMQAMALLMMSTLTMITLTMITLELAVWILVMEWMMLESRFFGRPEWKDHPCK